HMPACQPPIKCVKENNMEKGVGSSCQVCPSLLTGFSIRESVDAYQQHPVQNQYRGIELKVLPQSKNKIPPILHWNGADFSQEITFCSRPNLKKPCGYQMKCPKEQRKPRAVPSQQ